jgi:pyrophosphatase PpaX
MKAIFFDMDGVLVDSFDFWYELFNFTLKHFKYPELARDDFDRKIWGISTLEAAQKHLPRNTDSEMAEFYLKNYTRFDKYFKAYPKVALLLKQLREKNLKIVIVSNTHIEIAEDELSKCKLREHIDVLLCPNTRLKPKPYPDMIFEGLRQLGLKKEEMIFVGDTISDIRAGKAAGVRTIGLRIDGGNKRIEKVEEVLELIREHTH